jgi:hypothetical protein
MGSGRRRRKRASSHLLSLGFFCLRMNTPSFILPGPGSPSWVTRLSRPSLPDTSTGLPWMRSAGSCVGELLPPRPPLAGGGLLLLKQSRPATGRGGGGGQDQPPIGVRPGGQPGKRAGCVRAERRPRSPGSAAGPVLRAVPHRVTGHREHRQPTIAVARQRRWAGVKVGAGGCCSEVHPAQPLLAAVCQQCHNSRSGAVADTSRPEAIANASSRPSWFFATTGVCMKPPSSRGLWRRGFHPCHGPCPGRCCQVCQTSEYPTAANISRCPSPFCAITGAKVG